MRATMKYRTLGKTGLMVSEIGFGGEWLERHPEEEDPLCILKRNQHSGLLDAGSKIQRHYRKRNQGES